MVEKNLPIIIGISGASGTIYGIKAVKYLLESNYNVELVISKNAVRVAQEEINLHLSLNTEVLKEQVLSYLQHSALSTQHSALLNVWANDDIASLISSGSYRTQGMIIIPASMGTISAIANGVSDNLMTRAADVCMKEKRKLILVPREMPYSAIHLENLLKLSRIGVVIAPASPAFYSHPQNLNDSIDFVIGKVFDLFHIEHNLFKRWREKEPEIV